MAKQTTITIETSSVLILRVRDSHRAWCPECAAEGEMIAVDNTKLVSNLDQRAFERWLDSGELHRVNALDRILAGLPEFACWLACRTPTRLSAASRACRMQKRREYEIQIAIEVH